MHGETYSHTPGSPLATHRDRDIHKHRCILKCTHRNIDSHRHTCLQRGVSQLLRQHFPRTESNRHSGILTRWTHAQLSSLVQPRGPRVRPRSPSPRCHIDKHISAKGKSSGNNFRKTQHFWMLSEHNSLNSLKENKKFDTQFWKL